ncbi:hypothetical protein SAMN04488060_0031 [Qipengyuania nanhaisediminis]|uniref:Uncharacterized protein n=2 Tax=Qipengyuania nanhaisediminis TaxID=604088 RepID=A0A1I5K9Z6_9SPHN|nr:hypothetical protein SAMN04488060_0031 [Qipengyuania nanhaisediminis]
MESVRIEDGIIVRGDLEDKLRAMAEPVSAATGREMPHIQFFNGSGGAGKSVLLTRAEKVIGPNNEVFFAGTQLPAASGDPANLLQNEPVFTGSASQWADALACLRVQFANEAKAKNAKEPTFRLFRAFHDHCIDPRSESERFVSEWRWLVRAMAAIGFVGGLLAAIDWIVSIDEVSDSLAAVVERILPGQNGLVRGGIGLFLAALTFAQLYAGVLTKGAFRVVEFFQARPLYKKFGETPRQYREKLRDEESSAGKELTPDVLIRAFNFDLERWLADLDPAKRIAIAIDVQKISNNLSVREGIYIALNRLLDRDGATGGDLQSRCVYILSSKYERMRLERGAHQSSYSTARKEATRVGFLAPEAAWALVGHLLECQEDQTSSQPLRAALYQLHSETDWRAKPDKNTPLAERRLPAFLHAMAFGSLAATAFFKLGRTSEEWHQTQAEYVRARAEGFMQRHGHKTPEDLLHAISDESDSFVDWLALDFSKTGHGNQETPFERAFGSMDAEMRQAVCLLGVFPHGLSKNDLTSLGFGDFDLLSETRRIEVDPATKRVVAKPEVRRIVLEGLHFKEALPQLEAIFTAFERGQESSADGYGLNVWGHTVSCLLDSRLTEQQVSAKPFVARIREMVENRRADPLSRENRHLGAQLCLEILMTFVADRNNDNRQELRAEIQKIVDRYLDETPESERSEGVLRIANRVDKRRGNLTPIFDDTADMGVEDEDAPEAVVDHIDNTFALAGSLQSFAALQQLDPATMEDDLRHRYFRLLRKTGTSLATRESAPLPPDESHQKLVKPLLASLEAGCRSYPSMAGDLAFLMVRTVTEWRAHLDRHYDGAVLPQGECDAEIAFATNCLTNPETRFFAPFDSDLWGDFGAVLRRDASTKQPCASELDDWFMERRRAFFTDACERYTEARDQDEPRWVRFNHLAEALAVSLKLVFDSEGPGWRVDPREQHALRQEARRVRSFYLFFVLNQLQKVYKQQPDQCPEYREARQCFVQDDFVGSSRHAASTAAERLLEVLQFANPADGRVQTGSLVVARPRRAVRRDGRWHIAFEVPNRSLRPLVDQKYAPPIDWGQRWKKAVAESGDRAHISGPLMLLGLRDGDQQQEYWPASARGFMSVNSADKTTRFTIYHVRKLLDLFMPLGPRITDADDPQWIGSGGSNSIMVYGGDEGTLRIARSGKGILIEMFRELARLRRVAVTGWGDAPRPSDEWFELEAKANDFVVSFYSRSDLPPKTPRQAMFIPVWDDEIGNFRMRTNHPDRAIPADDPRALRTFNSLFKKAFFDETPIYDFDFDWAMRKEAGRQSAS